jgi:diguanylate cyclase (GGDEF)-like protein
MYIPDTPKRHAYNAEVLRWQSRIRLTLAGLLGAGEGLLQVTGIVAGSAATTLAVVAAYAATVGTLAAVAGRRQAAGAALVGATIVADVLLVFGATFAALPGAHADRTLLLAFFVVHLTEFYFGRRTAVGALATVVVAYLALVGLGLGAAAPWRWVEELWSLAVFVLVAALFLVQYGTFRLRLRNLVTLFAGAEDGNFSQEYDVAADARPDSITLVGRAYNRFRSQLATMVLTDPLSGCLNRLGFEQQLGRETARAARAGSSVALIAIDVDDFKQVNDTLGHLAGDAVIEETGALLRLELRAGDSIARVGGDEFVILLPDTDLDGAMRLADRLREAYRARPFTALPAAVRLSVSVGVVAEVVTSESAGEDLRARADEALYIAKREGRDRVRAWSRAARRASPLGLAAARRS